MKPTLDHGILIRRKGMKLPHRFTHFVHDVFARTPIIKMIVLLISLWMLFGAAMFLAEQRQPDGVIASYGDALYWGVAAFSTAGIAETPRSGAARLIGAGWIVIGSVLFFGTIVATITAYFMRPLQRPVRQIVETIEYNLEQLDELSVEELDVLKKTTDALIMQVERQKKRGMANTHLR
jgi:voltage-gated potassium channel